MLKLRPATLADVPTLKAWDQEPHVISATTDDPDADNAFEGIVWEDEIAAGSDVSRYYVAELDGRPIGAMQVIDPHLEPTHYWGDIAPNLRAVDIWIGAPADLGQGHGEEMMRQALALCFADEAVTAVIIDPLASNTRAHKFYQRIGFKPIGRRLFNGEDDCLVHELTRADWRSALSAK
ncbi:MAG: GNAT family N-acetyltransferase [Alphaproteobacteria bacterium]|mgnify:CR=1 FL=1|nr:GNAT family N-acetyltransferase [Alphaproteobacteria bacterium]